MFLDAPNGVFAGPVSFVEVPAAGEGGGHALPHDVRGMMEQAFGAGLSAIRIHVDASAEVVDAEAYTRGTDIHFAPGRYAPGSTAGLALLGHEIRRLRDSPASRPRCSSSSARSSRRTRTSPTTSTRA